MDNTLTLVVNMFGGPAATKSTTVAAVFAELKLTGIECEIALEYAKEKTWEESFGVLDDQIYIFSKQLHRYNIVKNKVPVLITDSPLLLSIIYDKEKLPELRTLVLNRFNIQNNLNIFLNRIGTYTRNGRTQTLEQAIQIDEDIKQLLFKEAIEYVELDGGRDCIPKIVDLIKQKL